MSSTGRTRPRLRAITNQSLNSIKIDKLKCINDLTEIKFGPNNVTAILGPNGSGKSTILHAIACIYKPDENNNGEDHKLIEFFPRSPDSEWNGSRFSISINYRIEDKTFNNEEKIYGKNGSRWQQIYARRPVREVYYLGIDKCVPMIESEKKGNVNYETTSLSDELSTIILNKASFILNKSYSVMNNHILPNGKRLIGVGLGDLRYSSLSMSAGEQKVFLILNTLFSAGKNSLIIIDEIDLLLHDKALKNLISVICERAKSKNIQVVFTTHRESILNMSSILNIRHVVNIKDKSYCFEETKPDAINRLTGERNASVEIYVEDEMAASIISKICSSMKASKHINIIMYGAAINAFTLLAAETLKSGSYNENMIYVLDGDEYDTPDKKDIALKRVLTGNDARAIELRRQALDSVIQFNLPHGKNPEAFIHEILSSLHEDEYEPENAEIIEAAKNIHYESDSHEYINHLIRDLGIDRKTGLTRIIDLIAKTEHWDNYVRPIVDKINPIISSLHELDISN